MRQLPVDFREFIVSLNSNDVRYLLIGGWAVGYYGYPRATKDIDFYPRQKSVWRWVNFYGPLFISIVKRPEPAGYPIG